MLHERYIDRANHEPWCHTMLWCMLLLWSSCTDVSEISLDGELEVAPSAQL